MQSLTTADLSNEAFPFRAAREIDIGFARVLCIRITYLGELGYELYIPTEQAMHVYDRLVGSRARSACGTPASRRSRACAWRRATATTATTSTTPTPCSRPGLGFAVDLKKPGGFIGKDAVVAQKAAGPLTRRIVQILVKDPEPMLFHAEVVRRNGKPVGYVRAASYGPHARRRGRARDDRIARGGLRPARTATGSRGGSGALVRSTRGALGAKRPACPPVAPPRPAWPSTSSA